jgi:hypothetical protein
VVAEDQPHLEHRLRLFGAEPAQPLERRDRKLRFTRERRHGVEVEDITVEDQLDRALGCLADVAEKTLEALVDEQITMLVTLPQGVVRIDILGICQVKVTDDGRESGGFEPRVGRGRLDLDDWLPGA